MVNLSLCSKWLDLEIRGSYGFWVVGTTLLNKNFIAFFIFGSIVIQFLGLSKYGF